MTLTKPYEATFYIGDNSTKTFSFLFDEVSENFIKVVVKRIDSTIYTPIFSVDMELKQVVFGEDEITPTAEDVICIYRETPAIQDTQFNTLQGYNAKALENILSKIVAMIQEMKANGFSTQILQGEPWSLGLIKPADDGASVQIDYQARVLKKGLYFKMSDGNLLASADGVNFVQMPKSAEVKEFRHREDKEGNTFFEYRIDKGWLRLLGANDSYDKTQIDNFLNNKLDKQQGIDNVGKVMTVGGDGKLIPRVPQGGGIGGVIAHDDTLFGAGTDEFPLGVKDKVTITIEDLE